MRAESRSFLKNIHRNNFVKILNFYKKILRNKFSYKINRNKRSYPKRALLFKSCFKNKIEKNNFNNFKIDQEFELSSPLKSMIINPIIQWDQLKNENDYEIKLSFHRFYWLDITKKNPCIENFEKLLNSWFSNFYVDKDAWHPYTASERLTTILFYFTSNFERKKILELFRRETVLIEILNRSYNTLLNNIEYTQNGNTFNHVVNNYKGLILCGLVLNDKVLINKSIKILLEELELILEDDFFFREGSSHYQFIILKWLIEIKYFFEIFDKNNIDAKFSNVLNLVSDKASFFIVQGLSFRIPIFGDISPDFSPDWILKFIYKFNKIKFFTDFQIKNLKKIKFYNSKNKTFHFTNYTRINKGFWTLFVKHTNCRRTYFPDHSHEDESQFVLFYKGNPLVIDPGRVNYNDKFNKDKFCLNSVHNVARLNGISCFNTRNYPYIPSNLKHSVNKRICNEGKQFIFELTSESIFRINYNKCDKYIRRFTLNEKEFIIEDDFLINKPCKYELSINFSENFKIKRIDQKSLHVSNKKNKFIIKNNTNYSINNSTYSESYNSQKSGTSIIFTKKINKKFKNRFRIKLFS